MPVPINNRPIRTLPIRPNPRLMLMSSCSQFLTQRPVLAPAAQRLRVPSRPAAYSPLNRSFRISESNPKSAKNKWKISCFRREEFSSEPSHPELNEDLLPEELLKPVVDNSSTVKKEQRTSLVEVSNAVLKAIGSRWIVPWTAETTLQVMLFWFASFWFVGTWMIPFAAHISGINKESLTFRGQALYSLVTDITEGLVGFAILHQYLSPFQPLPSDWFKFCLKGNWLIDVALGCLMFPLVNKLSMLNLLIPALPSTPITPSTVEQSIVARDPVAMALYAIVVSVCAPVWEEIMFRGFLLPSLTKYMPVWSAILVSSVVFALAHFNVHRMLPLVFLGIVMGVIFSRSRNLLPSMLLHSLWNTFVFLHLMR